MSELSQLDLQQISAKLKPLSSVAQTSKETMIPDDCDVNTKNFLLFIIKTIETAKANKLFDTEVVISKVNGLVKDANELLSNYFENNSLSSYYDKELLKSLESLSNSLQKTGESFDVERVKSSIVDALKTLYATNEAVRQKQFETSLSSFKKEFAETFTEEIESKTEVIQKDVEKKVKEEVEKNKSKIEKEINRSTKLLLYKTVPEYMKSLDKVFSKNFKQYIEANFTNKVKQLTIANKLRNTFNGILMPFAFAAKYVKSAKDGLFTIGKNVKKNLSEKILGPISAWKDKIKFNISEKMHEIKVGFLRATRFIRRPAKTVGLWLGKIKKKLDSNDALTTFKNFGLIGLLAKGLLNLIRRTKKNFRLLSQMDFKPFKFLSVLSNSVDEFIDSVASHTNIILSNLKIFFDENVVEEYDVRKKHGFIEKIKSIFKKKKDTDDGGSFNLMSFFSVLPTIVKVFKRFWKLIKNIFKFLKGTLKFILKVSRALISGISRFIGKALAKVGVKLGWKVAAKSGEKMVQWGSKGIGKAAGKTAGKAAGKMAGKTVGKAAGKTAGQTLGKVAGKTAGKVAGQAAGKTAGKIAGKLIPSPIGTITAFAIDATFAYMEAQDTDTMARLYKIDASQVGAQQRTSYVIAGTLIGGESLLDVNWSNPVDLGAAAISTGMTMMKWAGVGAMIGSFIGGPGLGTVIGGAIGAGLGLVFSLIGTERLAKAINWICDASKAVWGTIKSIGNGIASFGKMAWSGLKNLWGGVKNFTNKLGSAISATKQKIKNFFSSIKDKISNNIHAITDKVKSKFVDIGDKLKNSIGIIGKSLLSTIFPFSPLLVEAGKAIGNFFKGVKNFFFGEDDNQKQLDEIKKQFENVQTVVSNSYSTALHKRLQDYIILNELPTNEGEDISQTAKKNIFDISKLTDLIDNLLDVPPTMVPVLQQTEDKEKTLATTAANYWSDNEENNNLVQV